LQLPIFWPKALMAWPSDSKPLATSSRPGRTGCELLAQCFGVGFYSVERIDHDRSHRTITACRFHSPIHQVSPLLQHTCSTSATQFDRCRPPHAPISRTVRARGSYGPSRADDGLEIPCSTDLSAQTRRGAVHHASGSCTPGGGGSVL
jgi:hypothetical protein